MAHSDVRLMTVIDTMPYVHTAIETIDNISAHLQTDICFVVL